MNAPSPNGNANSNSINSNNILERNIERTIDRNQQGKPLSPNYSNGNSNNNLLNQLPNNLQNNLHQPASPSNVQTSSSDQQQIFILCSLLATSLFFLLLLILFILFKQRKRHFKNKNKATILQLDKLGSDEHQQMLLLMQQQNSTQVSSSLNRTNAPTQILISGNNRGYLQQPPPLPLTNHQTELARNNNEKMHLIARLQNQTGTMIDHLLVRNSNNDNFQQQSSNNKRISPFSTINNNNFPVLQTTNTISNSNVSNSLTSASVNSNPSHNSDDDHQFNNNNIPSSNHHTPKYNRTNHLNSLIDTSKASPMFTNKLNLNLNGKFSTNKYLVNQTQCTRGPEPNYAYNLEEPDYAEPILQSLESSNGELEKFASANNNRECKQSINSQSNSSNRSPSDSDNYDNYDQFEYDQYYEQYENGNYSFKNGNEYKKNEQLQFKEYIETDNLLAGEEQNDGYDSVEQTAILHSNHTRPPLPKTLPPSSFTAILNQRSPSNFTNSTSKFPHHLNLNSTDAFNNLNNAIQSNSKRKNYFKGTNTQTSLLSNNAFRNSNRKMAFITKSNTNLTSNSSTTNSINKSIEVS